MGRGQRLGALEQRGTGNDGMAAFIITMPDGDVEFSAYSSRDSNTVKVTGVTRWRDDRERAWGAIPRPFAAPRAAGPKPQHSSLALGYRL